MIIWAQFSASISGLTALHVEGGLSFLFHVPALHTVPLRSSKYLLASGQRRVDENGRIKKRTVSLNPASSYIRTSES